MELESEASDFAFAFEYALCAQGDVNLGEGVKQCLVRNTSSIRDAALVAHTAEQALETPRVFASKPGRQARTGDQGVGASA